MKCGVLVWILEQENWGYLNKYWFCSNYWANVNFLVLNSCEIKFIFHDQTRFNKQKNYSLFLRIREQRIISQDVSDDAKDLNAGRKKRRGL